MFKKLVSIATAIELCAGAVLPEVARYLPAGNAAVTAHAAEEAPSASDQPAAAAETDYATIAETYESDCFTYTISDDEAAITSCDASVTGGITVPSTIDDYRVTSIASSAFSECKKVESIVLPTSVTYVGHYAFENCTALSSIDLGKVQELGYYVFRGCPALTSLTIPASLVTTWRDGTDGSLADSSITSVTFEEGIANIPGYICAGASALVQVRLPEKEDTVDGYKIGNYAFSNCSFLSDINIPNSVTAIGEYAFANCKNLGTIRLPSSISSLSRTVFQDSKVENVLIAKEDSPVALALIDSEIPYTADESGIQDAPADISIGRPPVIAPPRAR